MKIKNTKLNSKGFSHLVILSSVFVVVLIVVIGVYVANHKTNTTLANDTSTSKAGTTPKTVSSSNSSAATAAPVTTSTSTPLVVKAANSAKLNTATSTSTPATNSTTSSTSTPTPAETPLTALTDIITGLDNASAPANVTAATVTIPGPINDATGRPIVFTLSGQTYFAYTQESEPNFNQSASATADSMAIVLTSTNPSLTQGHLDKTGLLVDEDSVAVGYSTGGDSGK